MRVIHICLNLLLIFFIQFCIAKERISISVQQYYESQLPLKHSIKIIASDWDDVITRGRIFHIKPILSTLELYNQLNLPVVIWTNNSISRYCIKFNMLRKHVSFEPRAVFVFDDKLKKGFGLYEYSSVKKPAHTYYIKAYEYTKSKLKLTHKDTVVFIDDKADNVDAARAVAKKYKLPIVAIQYTTPEQLKHDFMLLTKDMYAKHTAVFNPVAQTAAFYI